MAVPNLTLLTVSATDRVSELALGADGVVWPAHESARPAARHAAIRNRARLIRGRKVGEWYS
jgi:hypothetical protein